MTMARNWSKLDSNNETIMSTVCVVLYTRCGAQSTHQTNMKMKIIMNPFFFLFHATFHSCIIIIIYYTISFGCRLIGLCGRNIRLYLIWLDLNRVRCAQRRRYPMQHISHFVDEISICFFFSLAPVHFNFERVKMIGLFENSESENIWTGTRLRDNSKSDTHWIGCHGNADVEQ